MTEVISVRFKSKGKVYFFSPNGITVTPGGFVIVETAKGLEYAECVRGNHEVEDDVVIPPLRPVIRLATDEDAKRAEENRKKEKEAFEICKKKIEQHELDMKLVDVEYNFEGNKILFFFTSDGRVDFRDLVKDLASIFKTRIELRQIGVRDEARMLGGLGICGKPFCCAQFLDDFQPVSIKMAKTQGLSLNPTKISGTCGRLMCCLKYEQEAYEDLVKDVPKVDSFVDTPDGKGLVIDVNLLRGKVRVKLDEHSELTMKTYEAAEVQVLGGKAARAEYLANRTQEMAEIEAKKAEAKAAAEARKAEAKAAAEARKAASEARRAEAKAAAAVRKAEAHAAAEARRAEEKEEKEPVEQKKTDGGNKNHHSKHHSHKSGGHKPQEHKAQEQKPAESKAKEAPKQEHAEKPAGEAKKTGNNHRRRHYRPKKKPAGGNGAPKAGE